MNLSPKPFQVVRHLLKCSEVDAESSGNIYDWLNDNTKPSESAGVEGTLHVLELTACTSAQTKFSGAAIHLEVTEHNLVLSS